MRIECISETPTRGQRDKLGPDYRASDHGVTEGKQYIVFGLQFQDGGKPLGRGTWFHVENDTGLLGWVPLPLVRIVDDRVPAFWRISRFEHGVRLWPAALEQEYFHDDLAEGVPEVVEAFKKLRLRLLEDETWRPPRSE